MVEMILAGTVLAACALLLLRQLLPAAKRQRVDAAASHLVAKLRRRAQRLFGPRQGRDPLERKVEREAQDLIDRARHRARGSVRRDGNVYRPDAFRPSRPPSGRDKLH